MSMMSRRYYVRAITAKGKVMGYGVYDNVGGLESQETHFDITKDQSAAVALYLANTLRDDLNGAKPEGRS